MRTNTVAYHTPGCGKFEFSPMILPSYHMSLLS
jgi:hypothetical protein